MSGEPVEEQYIEYTYTTYKMPSSEDITSGGAELAQAIAARVFPDAQDKGGNLWKIAQGEKTYICGFVANNVQSAEPTEMYFVTIQVTEGVVKHVNCYKCNVGDVRGAFLNSGYRSILIRNKLTEDSQEFFKCPFGAESDTKFITPAHSFFLEGEHQAFNDLPAGTYDATLLA